MKAVIGWFRERLPISGGQIRDAVDEPLPAHLKQWWFCLGGTPAYLFLVQIVTGILLAFYYQPSPGTAYESVRDITYHVDYGWFIRGLHKWGATLMVAAVVLHQIRVYFTGAYRKPREINWMVGMLLLMLTLTTGFTGYSLVFEQLSYWGATVAGNISDTVPVIGGFLKRGLLGGDAYSARTLPRLFILHGAVLPVSMLFLLGVHIALIRLQGVAPQVPGTKEKHTYSLFPDHVLTELLVGLGLTLLLAVLATTLPAELGPKANPLSTPELIKPEWYFYATFRWLKLFSGTAAVLSMGFIVFVMGIWPLIDGQIRKRWKNSEFSVWVGLLGASALIGLTVWEAAVAH